MMFVLGNLLEAVARILDSVLYLYSFVLVIGVLVSWVSADPSNPIVRFLRAATEPMFSWVRQRLPFVVIGMLDLSPLFVLLVIWFLRMFLVGTLLDLSLRIR
jgi:YggT family protein